MGKIGKKSISRAMAVTFFTTVCVICVLSGVTIFLANMAQQRLLETRAVIVRDYDYEKSRTEYGFIIDTSTSHVEWEPLGEKEQAAYIGCYVLMIGLPLCYTIFGIGLVSRCFYQKRLRTPIQQLQKGMQRIWDNDLEFVLDYSGEDELGLLCNSMEKMRRELLANNRKLWDMIEQRRLLNSSVAHDLRTPITVLRGYLDYLQKNIADKQVSREELAEVFEDMQGAVTRLSRYVDCVRDVDRLESIEVKKQSVNTAELTEEWKRNLDQLSGEKQILFTSAITAEYLQIDKELFFRVLENIVQNALRYARTRIEISVMQQEAQLVVTVKDDGRGFRTEELSKAAELFYSSEKGEEHFGIGLGVCSMLCEKLGGWLELANGGQQEGAAGGACVTVRIFS